MPCMIEIDMLESLNHAADFTEISSRNHLSEISSIEKRVLQVDPIVMGGKVVSVRIFG